MHSILREKIWERIVKVSKTWSRFECGSLAAAVAFFAALSIFPLTIVLVSGVGIFFEFFEGGKTAKDAVLEFLSEQISPEFSAGLTEVFSGVQAGALTKGPIAVVGLLITASLGFAQIVRGFDRIWEVRRRKKSGFWNAAGEVALNRLLSVVMVFTTGFLVVFFFLGNTLFFGAKEVIDVHFPDLGSGWGLRPYLVSIAGATLCFSLVYHSLAKGKARWRASFSSGLLAAILWEVGRILLAKLVIGSRFSTYGIVGSFLTLLLWIYYGAMVLFVGAVLGRVLTDEKNGVEPDADPFGTGGESRAP